MTFPMSEQLTEIKELFQDRSMADVHVLHGAEVSGNPNNDYFIEWSIRAEPKNQKACPIEIFSAEPDCFGFGIGSFSTLAEHLGLRWSSKSDLFVAGHEPRRGCVDELLENCSQIIHSGVSIQYQKRFGSLVSAEAFLCGKSLFPIKHWAFGTSGRFQYQPW